MNGGVYSSKYNGASSVGEELLDARSLSLVMLSLSTFSIALAARILMGFTLFYGNLGGCEDVNEGMFSATKNLSTSASSRDGTTNKLKVRPTKKAWDSRLFLHSQTLWQPLPCPTSVGSSLKLNFHHADGSIVL